MKAITSDFMKNSISIDLGKIGNNKVRNYSLSPHRNKSQYSDRQIQTFRTRTPKNQNPINQVRTTN